MIGSSSIETRVRLAGADDAPAIARANKAHDPQAEQARRQRLPERAKDDRVERAIGRLDQVAQRACIQAL